MNEAAERDKGWCSRVNLCVQSGTPAHGGCHCFLKHTSLLPLLGTKATISRKANQCWDFFLSLPGRELLWMWGQGKATTKGPWIQAQTGQCALTAKHHKHNFNYSRLKNSPWSLTLQGALGSIIFCFSAHLLVLFGGPFWSPSSPTSSQATANSILAPTTPTLISLTRTQMIYHLFKKYLKSTSLRYSLYAIHTLSVQNRVCQSTQLWITFQKVPLCPCGITFSPDLSPS